MTSKILRSDNTPIPSIKSVRFVEKINSSNDLRPGCVSSAYIDVTVYGAASSAPSAGEPLKYYQVDANGVETYIGTFYAEPSIQSRNTYSFVAYDIVGKLDVGFSERLLAIQANFPMELSDLVSEACSVAGVQLLSTNFPMHDMEVQSFFAEGLTCRDILSYAAEIACRYVKCDENEKIAFEWYAEKEDYRIYPTSQDGTETKVAYKQNGLSYQAYSVPNAGCVAVRPINTENAAYIYPSTFTAVTATDPLLNGVVTLYNLTAVDDGNGGVTLSGDFTATDTNSNVAIESDGGASNCLVISNNILLTNATASTMEDVAEHIYTEMATIPVYRPARAELFPSENPFRAGDIVAVTDIQNVSFSMPVMSMTVEQSAAAVEATGNRSYAQDYGNDTSKQLQNLSNSIVQIDRLKVGYAEIDTSIVNSLTANGIDADWINAGSITVKDANNNILFQADIANKEVQIGGLLVDHYGLWGSQVNTERTNYGKTGMAYITRGSLSNTTRASMKMASGVYPTNTSDTSFSSAYYGEVYPNLQVYGDVAFEGKLYYVDQPFVIPNGGHHRELVSEIDGLRSDVGNLSNLSTTDKSSLVAAINELYNMITT